jgi:hypothetical protein
MHKNRMTLAVCMGASLVVGGCGRDRETNAASEPREENARSIVTSALDVARFDGPMARALAPSQQTWVRTDDVLTSPGWRAAAERDFAKLGVRVRASGAEIGIGQDNRLQLRVEWLGAETVAPREVDGRIVQENLYRSTDSIVVSDDLRMEQLFVLRDKNAPEDIAWKIDLGQLRAPEAERDGTLVFRDAEGRDALRVPTAYAVDARGVRREAELAYEDGALHVRMPRAGLAYPVLLDPAVEVAVWVRGCTTSCGTKPASGGPAAFDARIGKVVLVSGATYAWDGQQWSTLAASNGALSVRGSLALAFDALADSMIAHGGNSAGCVGGYCNDTWVWDYAKNAWTTMSNLTTPATMMGRGNAAIAYDAQHQQLVMFGGETATTSDAGTANVNLAETWVLTSTGANQWAWVQKNPAVSPPPRNNARMVYDSKRHRVLLAGGWGHDPANYADGGAMKDGPMNDLWAWDGNNWSPVVTATSPPRRTTFGMAYEANRDRVVVFGGWGVISGTLPYCDDGAKNCNRLGDTWEFDGANWAMITTTAAPEARVGMAFASDALRGHAVGFGGWADPTSDETWEYYTRGGACSIDAGTTCPSGSCVDGVCCESTSCGECSRCDNPSSPGACAPVEDGTACSNGGTCRAGTCNAGNASHADASALDAGSTAPAPAPAATGNGQGDAPSSDAASSGGCSSSTGTPAGSGVTTCLVVLAALAVRNRRRRA